MTSPSLHPTFYIDSDSPIIKRYCDNAVGNEQDPVHIASKLFYAIRDGIRYNPYAFTSFEPQSFVASVIAASTENWCIPKSVLFVACARHKGIPAKLGFADVKNHLTSEKLTALMGSDIFAWHGYAELLLNKRWIKLSTAFNKELCQKLGTNVLEFDPINGSLLHPFDKSGKQHMEYITQRGSYNDLPLSDILECFNKTYPTWFNKLADKTFA